MDLKISKNSFPKCILSVSFILILFSCGNKKRQLDEQQDSVVEIKKETSAFKLSLAQWSLNREVREQGISPFLFAQSAKDMGFEGVEYVSQLYTKEVEKLGFDRVIDSLKILSESVGVENVLIMVDHEGDLADPDLEKRNLAVENHKKWVDAAQKLGAHAIRVNTFGTNDPELWKEAVVDGLKKLATYAATKNINVLCENHGWLSSDAPKLVDAIKTVNMDNCGTLPDFGNWCIKRAKGENWGDCLEEYPDKYEGIKIMLPLAKAISAKCYDFDDAGNETTIDFAHMMSLIKASGYKGYISVEYEGKVLAERKGILAAKELLLKHFN
ncbi:sugar phosphate isomerase/epimerase family protein [Hyunsoonleella sp. 2307UL5-6]|uniref:sugar phosphate isomerase/epimerase family protein n=1 Tax=Hyunsoonleella sp. 2307UL5-6 TaxID=3384768 RepID=UPI0039BD5BAD